MGTAVLFLVVFMVVMLGIRSLYLRFRPRVEVVCLGDRVEVILYYVSRDGKTRKRVII